MTTTLQIVESLKRKNEAKNARIQMLLRTLADKDAQLRKVREERDTYAHGLHQLRDELFKDKMRMFVSLTDSKGASQ